MPETTKKRIKRSRLGCHRCKKLKIKCSEDRPACVSCSKANASCDYSLKLTWGGRPYKNAERRKASQIQGKVPASQKGGGTNPGEITFVASKYDKTATAAKNDDQLALVVAAPAEKPEVVGPVKLEIIDDLVTDMAPSVSHTSTNLSYSLQNESVSMSPERGLSPPDETSAPFSLMHNTVSPDRNLDHIASPSNHHSISVLNGMIDGFSHDLLDFERHAESNLRSTSTNSPKADIHGWSPNAVMKSPSIGPVQLINSSPSASDPLLRYHSLLPQPSPPEASQALHTLYSIPPQLTPLPDIMLRVPCYRQLLKFWVEVASDELVPAPSHLYTDNPFKVLVPQMAMRYPGVLTTVLAFAARWRGVLTNDLEDATELVDQLLNRSCNELLKQLQNEEEATSDGALLTALLLSCYEVVNSNDFDKHRTHTIGASQIVFARTAGKENQHSSPSSEDSDNSDRSLSVVYNRDESNTAFFLTRWFFYVDVLGALSATRGQDKYLRGYRNTSYTPVNTVNFSFNNVQDLDLRNDIDFFMGFDSRIIPHLINIALLIREVERLEPWTDDISPLLPLWIVSAALELKAQLTTAHTAGEARRQARTERSIDTTLKSDSRLEKQKGIDKLLAHDNTLRATNKLFFYMGMINLYRRVLKIPRLSPIIQDIANDMADVLRFGVEPRSSAELCTIFCHFCAGCELLDTERRQHIYERHSWMAQSGNNNATKSLKVMARCWETGEDWISAAEALDIDLVLM